MLRLMDEAREAGMKLGVCSAATKSTVEATLLSLLGKGRFEGLDVFLAGEWAAPFIKGFARQTAPRWEHLHPSH